MTDPREEIKRLADDLAAAHTTHTHRVRDGLSEYDLAQSCKISNEARAALHAAIDAIPIDRAERAEAALRELVYLRNLGTKMNAMALGERIKSDAYIAMERDYESRSKPAWAAARAIVEGES